jgi:HEAT repeat protein
MKKKLLTGGVLLLIAIAVVLLVPAARYKLLGRLRDEQFVDGMPTSYWAHQLHDDEPTARVEALRALRQTAPADPAVAVPALTEALKDDNEMVRELAVKILGDLGPSAGEAVPALIAAIQDEDSQVQQDACHTLGKIGPEAREAIPALRQALLGPNDYVHSAAAIALQRLDRQAAVPALIASLEEGKASTRPTRRRQVALELAAFGAEARAALPALIRLLKEDAVRAFALDALGGIGPDARAAVPQIVAALKDKDEFVRERAAKALEKIDPEASKKARAPETRPRPSKPDDR